LRPEGIDVSLFLGDYHLNFPRPLKVCEKERRGNKEGNAGGNGGKGEKGIREEKRKM